MRTGQRSYIPGIGHIHVRAVEPIQLAELTDIDAQSDGFDSLPQLKQALGAIYGADPQSGCALYRVRFELISESNAAGPNSRASSAT